MDRTEAHARKYIEHLGFTDIGDKTDGKAPPDFVLDGRIAVEVRRLNQNENTSGRTKGLEEVRKPLEQGIARLLASFGPPRADGISWGVAIRFQRPVPSWKTLKPKVKQWLTDIRDGERPAQAEASFGKHFLLSLARTDEPRLQLFWLVVITDRNAHGWPLQKLESNLRFCIEEKRINTTAGRRQYPEWWLLLVDLTGFGFDESDCAELRASGPIGHDWNKIILVAPDDHTKALEI